MINVLFPEGNKVKNQSSVFAFDNSVKLRPIKGRGKKNYFINDRLLIATIKQINR